MEAEARGVGDGDDVFVYAEDGLPVPGNIVRARVDETVTRIPDHAFQGKCRLEAVGLCDGVENIGKWAFSECEALKSVSVPSTVAIIQSRAFYSCGKLANVILREGLVEIGERAFYSCPSMKGENYSSLKKIDLPSTLKRIGSLAFGHSGLVSLRLPDGLEHIGERAMTGCKQLTTFRIPPPIETLPSGLFINCESLLSIETTENLTQVESRVFHECFSLRNVALPLDAKVEKNAFHCCKELLRIFGSEENIISALKRRFVELPVHKMLYHQSNNVSIEDLNNAINLRSGQRRTLRCKLDPRGKLQDCLGMNPLHVLACSAVQDIELYKILVGKYPENLIVEDKWDTLPLLYAVWTNAPSEVIQFLLESYESYHPKHVLDWTKMMKALARSNAPTTIVECLLSLQQEAFPEQRIDFMEVLRTLVIWRNDTKRNRVKTLRFIVKSAIELRVKKIGVKRWREEVTRSVKLLEAGILNIESGLSSLYAQFGSLEWLLGEKEREYQKLVEATSMFELCLWKVKLDESSCIRKEESCSKKFKVDESDFRKNSRISCGAEQVIENVLPFLLPSSK